jgi:hypothetical protein
MIMHFPLLVEFAKHAYNILPPHIEVWILTYYGDPIWGTFPTNTKHINGGISHASKTM